MTNEDLGEFISQENYKETISNLLAKSEQIMGAGIDIVSSVFTGFPVYSILQPFLEGINHWKSRVELKQLAYFLKEFENLTQNERSEFSIMIQKNPDDFVERLFYNVSQLNDRRKAEICGRLGVNYARKKIGSNKFLRLIEIVKSANSTDLLDLKRILESTGEKLLEDKGDPVQRKSEFLTKMFCHRLFDISYVELKVNLRTLNILESKMDFDHYGLNPASFTLDDVRHQLTQIRYFDYFTVLAYELYTYGLKTDSTSIDKEGTRYI